MNRDQVFIQVKSYKMSVHSWYSGLSDRLRFCTSCIRVPRDLDASREIQLPSSTLEASEDGSDT